MLDVEFSVQSKGKIAFNVEEAAFLRSCMFYSGPFRVSGRLKTIHLSLGNVSLLYDIDTSVNLWNQVCTS